MTFKDQLNMAAAVALDDLYDLVESVGTDAEISVVISHPGHVEDALVIGRHDLAQLSAILARMQLGETMASDVSATACGPWEAVK